MEIFSEGVCGCILYFTETGSFVENINLNELLYHFIRHLKYRNLSLTELNTISYIYAVLPGVVDQRYIQELQKIYNFAPNRNTVNTAFSQGGEPTRISALIRKRFECQGDAHLIFEMYYNIMQDAVARAAEQYNVSFKCFPEMIEAARGNRINSEKSIAWCTEYYYRIPSGLDKVLKGALLLMKACPGHGDELLKRALDSEAHRREAVEVLLSWPTDSWPQGLNWILESSLQKSSETTEKIKKAMQLLEKFDP